MQSLKTSWELEKQTLFLLQHTNNYTKLKDVVHLSSAGSVNMKMIEIQVRKQ